MGTVPIWAALQALDYELKLVTATVSQHANWTDNLIKNVTGQVDTANDRLQRIEQHLTDDDGKFAQILADIDAIGKLVDQSSEDVSTLTQNVTAINLSVTALTTAVSDMSTVLTTILNALVPKPVVAFSISLTSLDLIRNPTTGAFTPMAAKAVKAGANFQELDNGTAAGTLNPTDAAGLATVFPAGTTSTWVPSDPSVLTVTVNPDGLSAVITPTQPPKLATGVTILVTVTLPGGQTIAETSDGIDVIAGGPTGFTVSLQ